MPRILLDGADFLPAEPATTWGGLLNTLDKNVAPRERIVTDVRFDGLDEPAFREAAALERTLDPVAMVEVTSGTPAMLMERCLAEASSSIDALCGAAVEVGEAFRGHDIGEASRGLVQLAEGLATLTGIVGAAGLALHVDLASVTANGDTASSMVKELTSLIDTLIESQHVGDWITLADVLQYDVEPALRRWRPLLDAFPQARPAGVASA